jgi:outer membrane protein TolC
VRLKFARNQRLPQVDLRASYGIQGLSGRTNPAPPIFGGARVPTAAPRSYGNAHNTFFSDDQADSWSAGAVVSIPIGNTRGRADVRRARLELRRAMTQVRRQEQNIILEVRNAVRNLRSAIEGIASAQKRLEAADEQLRAERIRLEHGESTPFDVLQREEQYVEAESSQIAALRTFHTSVTDLDRAQGTILRDRNIVVDQALPLR